MYYNDFNLQQLLELALRVPEVGAVNFNILYYILKTIIAKEGLQGVKPVFSLNMPLVAQSNTVKAKLKKMTLRRSYSAESVKTINSSEVLKSTEHDEEDHSETPPPKSLAVSRRESLKWDHLKYFKRLDAIEEEISEIHIMLAQLVDKVSNFDRVFGLQETKLMKEIANARESLEWLLESMFASRHDPVLSQKIEDLEALVSVLKEKNLSIEIACNKYNEELEAIKEKNLSFEIACNKYNEEIEAIKEKNLSIEMACDKYNEELEAIKEKNLIFEMACDKYNEELEAIKEKNLSFEITCDKYNEELEAMKEKNVIFEMAHKYIEELEAIKTMKIEVEYKKDDDRKEEESLKEKDEGTRERNEEGTPEGTPEGRREGTPEGKREGTPEGRRESTPEGTDSKTKLLEILPEILPEIQFYEPEPPEVKLDERESHGTELGELDESKLDETKLSKSKLSKSKLSKSKLSKSKLSKAKQGKTKRRETILDETKLDKIEEDEIRLGTSKEEIEIVVKKTQSEIIREQELLSKIEKLIEDVTSIQEQLKEAEAREKEAQEAEKAKRIIEEQNAISKADIEKMDQQILDVFEELNKFKQRYKEMDEMFSSDMNKMREKILSFEIACNNYNEELEAIKLSWDEMIHSFEIVKDTLTYIETKMAALTELPGIQNRVEQLEEYVYSGSTERPDAVVGMMHHRTSDDEDTRREHKSGRKKSKKGREIQEYITEDDGEHLEKPGGPLTKFQVVSQSIAMAQGMEKKKGHAKKYKKADSVEKHRDSVAETSSSDEFEESDDQTHPEVTFSEEEKSKSASFTSPDTLEEYSRQLRGQIIVFVKKRLHDYDIEMQHIEGSLVTMRKKIEILEKNARDLGEKLTFLDANFSQRAADLAALKEMAENHHASIVNIMHHLDRKAEAYTVNQKVSRKELTVIEDRVLKLCVTASSEITKLEERIDDSLTKFSFELDKKVFTEEFELRLDFLLHKFKIFENKLKEAGDPVLDFQNIRPIEIKKYVVEKDGTKIKQGRTKISAWSNTIPILSQHRTDGEVSPKTAMQVQKELELTTYRESKRYAQGAYTKIKVGKK